MQLAKNNGKFLHVVIYCHKWLLKLVILFLPNLAATESFGHFWLKAGVSNVATSSNQTYLMAGGTLYSQITFHPTLPAVLGLSVDGWGYFVFSDNFFTLPFQPSSDCPWMAGSTLYSRITIHPTLPAMLGLSVHGWLGVLCIQ